MSSTSKLPVSQIGKYQLLRHIATGGMGSVYKAKDIETERAVALKILAPEFAKTPILVERFKREARHAQKLHHKHIVELYDYGETDGMHYIVMEYVDGIDLADYIRRMGRIHHEEARRIILHACKALSHAQEHGIVHRDIKPSNFLLANDEGRCRVKLTDLGLSRMADEEEFRVTRSGTTVGTVDYMAPEQARDASLADIRSDIYSLGCTLYHMLAGNPPFSEGGIGERVYKHIAADPPDIRTLNPSVPTALWTVLKRMLAKHPDDRYQTPDEVIEALRSMTDTPAVPGSGAAHGMGSPADSDVMEMTPPSLATFPEPTPPPPAFKPGSRHGLATPTLNPDSEPRRKRRTSIHEMPAAKEEADPLGVTPEHKSVANQQFTHATEVVRGDGDNAYALQLLLSSVKLDPANTLYRKVLREVGRNSKGGRKPGWFTALTTMPARSRLRSAGRSGDHRRVLELGEELLVRVPGDVSVQLAMADSAEKMGMPSLATWMLEEARQHATRDLTILRAQAALYERLKMLKHAIETWDRIRKVDPTDIEAPTKIKDLAASDTIARANQQRPR
jgi:serine/threonine protein kinase